MLLRISPSESFWQPYPFLFFDHHFFQLAEKDEFNAKRRGGLLRNIEGEIQNFETSKPVSLQKEN